MSQSFLSGDTVLWQPSSGVARLFVRSVEAVSPAIGVPTGLGPEVSDEYAIDGAVFAVFVEAMVHRYCASTHPVLRNLVEDVTAISIILAERTGYSVQALNDQQVQLDTLDVSVSTGGFGGQGDAERLRALADDMAASMPR